MAYNVVIIRPGATVFSQQGFGSWERAARAAAGWPEANAKDPVFIGCSVTGTRNQYTVGELRQEFNR